MYNRVDNRADNRKDNRADNRADNWAWASEIKLCVFKIINKKDANDKKIRMKKAASFLKGREKKEGNG